MTEKKADPLGLDTRDFDKFLQELVEHALSGKDRDAIDAEIAGAEKRLGIVKPVGLPQPVADRLREIAARYPHVDLDLYGDLSMLTALDLDDLEGFVALDAGEGVDADEMIAKGRDIVARARLASGRVTVHDALEGWQRGWIDADRAMELAGCEDIYVLYEAAYSSDVHIRIVAPIVIRSAGVMSGDPVIAGTRVLAEQILLEVLSGGTETEIMDDYPTLPVGVVDAVLEWSRTRT